MNGSGLVADRYRLLIRRFLLLFLLVVVIFPTAAAATTDDEEDDEDNSSTNTNNPNPFACRTSSDCEKLVGWGSECLGDGICSNPFAQGCLYRHNKIHNNNKNNESSTVFPLRVCNSDDPPNAATRGICRRPPIQQYPEVRLFTPNWETPVFESWIVQIILSELLGVPTTTETGEQQSSRYMNFYHPTPTYEYGPSVVTMQDALATAHTLGGHCTKTTTTTTTSIQQHKEDHSQPYQPCAHAILESWESNLGWVRDYIYNGTIEQPRPLGVLGMESWFVTKFTAQQDPTLTSYLGLQGESNRRKLAETFLRPTTWQEYCEQVSPTNCTGGSDDDGIAIRPPNSIDEQDRMFVEGLYKGHFRKTEENDCDLFPHNCTGHIADYPCGWSSYVEPQTYHLSIALSSSGKETGSRGYTYQQLTDMWKAANATKSNLLMFWWQPEPTIQSFMDSPAQFQRVLLPMPTQQCIQARLTPIDRCSPNWEDRVGNPQGSCDETPNPLQKLISKGLHDAIHHPSIPEAIRSPALDVLHAFSVSELQLGEMFELWQTTPTPREAICQWAIDNLETLQTFVPRNYPRVLQESETRDSTAAQYTSSILGGLATFFVLVTTVSVYRFQDARSIRLAQVEFLYILLLGLLLVAVGAIVVGLMPPSNGSCIASAWLILLGYSMELVPLVVKIAAIHRLHAAANKLKRVVLGRRNLFGVVTSICLGVVFFLVLWTLILDPPTKTAEYDLSNDESSSSSSEADSVDDPTVVLVSYHCSSQSDVWRFCALGWNCVLLLCCTVLAFQTRKTQIKWNESHTLALMIYSHVMFLVLRGTTFALSGSGVSESLLDQARSIAISLDVIATLTIYFLPKFYNLDGPESMESVVIRRLSLSMAGGSIGNNLAGLPASQPAPFIGGGGGGDGEVNPQQRERLHPLSDDSPCPHCGRTGELRQRSNKESSMKDLSSTREADCEDRSDGRDLEGSTAD